jgi:hypothetical protein
MAGKDVRALQLNHVLPKTAPELKSVALKSVMAVQSFHASPKLVPPAKFNAGKEVRALQLLHALLKLRASLGLVLNVIPEGKEANEVQVYQLL